MRLAYLAYVFSAQIITLAFSVEFEPRASPADNLSAWEYIGCYYDSASARTLPSAFFSSDRLTGKDCTSFCGQKGYSYAGTEYGQECWCGIGLGSAQLYPNDCTMTCTGDANETCGSGNRLTVYKDSNLPTPKVVETVNGYTYKGCYTDDVNNRTLAHYQEVQGDWTANSASACTQACFEHGYIIAGLEYSSECWCGNDFLNDKSKSVAGDAVTSGCSSACTGNNSEICGGADRLSLYTYTDTRELIVNGGFEDGNDPWHSTNDPTPSGKGPGLLTGGIVGNEYAAAGIFSYQIRDSFRNEAQEAHSLCVTQTVNHRKAGPHTLSAYIGRKPGAMPPDALNFELVVDTYLIASGEVCSPGNPSNPCRLAAVNGEIVYNRARLTLNLGPGDLGQRNLSICANFTGNKSASDVFLLDDVSVLGPA